VTPQVLYIGGAGRSGSTVLAGLLGRQQGFVAVGELRYLWDRGLAQNHLCGCRQPFRQCPFWTDVLTDAFGSVSGAEGLDVPNRARAVDRVRFVPALARRRLGGPGFERRFRTYGDVVARLYQSIITVSGAAVLVDSSKDPSYAFVLDRLPSLELSVVHLVRDSRAVAYSWTRTRVRPEVHWKVEYMQRRKPLRTALVWGANNLMFEDLGRGHPRFLRLRYEDFVASPDESLATVAALARGGRPTAGAAPGAGDSFVHTISGNPSRFNDGPLHIAIDDEWRRKLSSTDRRVVTATTAPLLVRYGYLDLR